MNEKNINNDMIREFFENPYTKEYLRFCNDSVRMAVAGITAACGFLEEALDSRSNTDGSDAFDSVREQCKNLMRTVELSTALIGGFTDKKLISVDTLLNELAAGCRDVLGGKYQFTVSGEYGGFVAGDPKTIKYIILGVIRGIVLNTDGRIRNIELSMAKSADEVRILVRCERNVAIEGNNILDVDISTVSEMLAQSLGGRFLIREDGCELILPVVKPDGRLDVRSSVRYNDSGSFSSYNIMLGGLANEMPLNCSVDDEDDMQIFNNEKN